MDSPNPPSAAEYIKQKMEEGFSEENAYVSWLVAVAEMYSDDDSDNLDD